MKDTRTPAAIVFDWIYTYGPTPYNVREEASYCFDRRFEVCDEITRLLDG